MKRVLPFLLFVLALTCNLIPKNPTDPNNPDYVKPYLIIDSTGLHEGDTVSSGLISLTVSGNTPDKNQYRYRLDSLTWSEWQPVQSQSEIRISLTEADSGKRTITIETCYHPNGDITDTAITIVKVNVPRIFLISDTVVQIASEQPLKMWIKATGTKPLSYQWLLNGTLRNGSTGDTVSFDSVKIADQGKYVCIAKNPWGADTSTAVLLSVSKTNYAPKWNSDTLRFVISEGQTLSRNLVDSCSDRNGELLNFKILHSPYKYDSLSSQGTYTFIAGLEDSGSYKSSAIVSDGELEDTTILLIVVRNVNRAPVFQDSLPRSSYQIKEGELLTVRFKVADADGDKVSYFIKQTNLPRKTEIAVGDSVFTWQSSVNDGGAYTIKLAAYDGTDTGYADIDIAVGNVNLPPRITIEGKTNGQTVTVKEQDTLRFVVQVNDPNFGDVPALLSVKNPPYTNAGNGTGSYDTINGKYLYVPSYTVSTKQQQGSFPAVLFIARDNSGSLDTFRITITVEDSNRVPSVVLLEPADNAQAVARNTVFKWQVTDLDADSISSTVRIGLSAAQMNTVQQSRDTTGSFPTVLQQGQEYFWQVSTSDGIAQTQSAVRKFKVNSPPTVSLTSPANAATGVGLPLSLTWQTADADSIDRQNITSTVYLWKGASTPVMIESRKNITSFSVQNVDYASNYNWYVSASDGKDTTKSATQTFTTLTPNCKLDSLVLSGGYTLTQAFHADTTTYTIYLPYRTDSLAARFVPKEAFAFVRVGNDTLKTKNYTFKNIPNGSSSRMVDVFVAGTNFKKTYTLNLVRNTYQPIYVNVAATGKNDGSSWVDAFTNLQDGIDSADSGDVVWVAKGTYYPTRKISEYYPRSISFILYRNISIYGSFNGTESILTERVFTAPSTLLSGDIGKPNDHTDNSCHVIYHGAQKLSYFLIDGIQISYGNANISGDNYDYGAALFIDKSKVVIQNCQISNNNSGRSSLAIYNCTTQVVQSKIHNNVGGVIYAVKGNLSIDNCIAESNIGSELIYAGSNSFIKLLKFIVRNNLNSPISLINTTFQVEECDFVNNSNDITNGHTSLRLLGTIGTVTKCRFIQNKSAFGASSIQFESMQMPPDVAPWLSGSVTINQCLFQDNESGYDTLNGFQGTVQVWQMNESVENRYNGNGPFLVENSTFSGNRNGALNFRLMENGAASVTNCTFLGNQAEYGAALRAKVFEFGSESSTLNIVNSTFTSNQAVNTGGATHILGTGKLSILNNIYWGNVAVNHNPSNELYIDSANVKKTIQFSIIKGNPYPHISNRNQDPLLGVLQNNGGFVPTLSIGNSSPAIDVGTSFVPTNVTVLTDARGVPRPQRNGIDIGAFELE